MEINHVIFGKVLQCGARIVLRSGSVRIVELRATASILASELEGERLQQLFSDQLPSMFTDNLLIKVVGSPSGGSPWFITGEIEIAPEHLPDIFRGIREQGIWAIHDLDR